jgi:putative spermidine/putrescine transport system substrate-binding protein
MVQLMQSGEYDGVSASGDATQRLMSGGDVVEIDPAEFSSYADVFEGLKLQPWNSQDGTPFGIPHGRGANLLVYNTEAFAGAAPDSWGAMFEAGGPADGAISVYDSPIYIADAALYLMATQPDLGITDPYALDQTQFDAAVALLVEQSKLTSQYWALYTDQQASLENGDVLAGTTWQVIVNLAQANGAKIDAVKPVEGATGWSDTWMLSSKAANPNCMKLWMNWIASPWANSQVAVWFGEAPSNAKSCELDGMAEHCDTFHAADDAYWKDVWYWTTATEECLDGRTDVKCVPYTEWVNAWNTLRT